MIWKWCVTSLLCVVCVWSHGAWTNTNDETIGSDRSFHRSSFCYLCLVSLVQSFKNNGLCVQTKAKFCKIIASKYGKSIFDKLCIFALRLKKNSHVLKKVCVWTMAGRGSFPRHESPSTFGQRTSSPYSTRVCYLYSKIQYSIFMNPFFIIFIYFRIPHRVHHSRIYRPNGKASTSLVCIQ